MKTDDLIQSKPFEHTAEQKKQLFLDSMKESLTWHYELSELFHKFVDSQKISIADINSIEQIPYLPISIFKELELITGLRESIKSVILSSATTSGKPSSIALDDRTMKRQQQALQQIMTSFLGTQRRNFIVFDAEATIRKQGQHISSRASALRGLLPFAKSMKFILNEKLEIDTNLLHQAVESVDLREPLCFFGFTWILYKSYVALKDNPEIQNLFQMIPTDTKVLHIGGWKKVSELQVSKEQFNERLGNFLNLNSQNIIDFYGMTEQLGTVYPDCEQGYKHLPLYADLIIRDVDTLEPLTAGKTGFIQLLTPLPHSYPGISLLTEDLGEIVGSDDCACGRKGKYFVFRKRLEKASLKGCGDIL